MPVAESPGVVLGAALGAAAKAGRDKLTLVISPEIASFGSWIEQLVAESTGKEGKGIVPVDLEPVGRARRLRRRPALRLHPLRRPADAKQDAAVAALERPGQPVVRIAVDRREALGREIFRWEMATAIAGATLGVNPFDEPNVTEAKLATSALLAHARRPRASCRRARGRLRGRATSSASARTSPTATPGDYLAFCAYFLRTPARDAALARLRVACRDRAQQRDHRRLRPALPALDRPAAQGRPEHGRLPAADRRRACRLPVPGEAYSFATLRNAQALGDLQVLRRRGRRALRVHLGRRRRRGRSGALRRRDGAARRK